MEEVVNLKKHIIELKIQFDKINRQINDLRNEMYKINEIHILQYGHSSNQNNDINICDTAD